MSNVYSSIEEKILSGEYKIGEQITENRISAELGVSRTPVREALMMLERDGLIDLIPNKGAVVRGISPNDLIDIYEIRKRLEGLAASLAALRIDKKGIDELAEIVDLSDFYIKKGDTEKIKKLDSEFHSCIYRYSGSRMLEKVLSDLHRSIGSYRKMSLEIPGRIEKSVMEHREIFNAIKDGDQKKSDDFMSHHVGAALDNLLSLDNMR